MTQFNDEQKKRLMQAGRASLNMSHGVKNILQANRTGKDIMNEALKSGDLDLARRTWTLLDQNLKRIEKLILDMLKFSKDEKPQIQPCDFNRLIESTVKTIRPQADQRQIDITTQLDTSLQQVPGDPAQMQDVVLNLLINAIEAVRPGTGQVTVHTELDRDNQQVILRISDNGPGIDNADKIFEPFYTTKSNLGAGLGLTIARNIVTRHAGTIDVQAQPGQGTLFTIRIPLSNNSTA